MGYEIISADTHLDLRWLPHDLFTSNAPDALKSVHYHDTWRRVVDWRKLGGHFVKLFLSAHEKPSRRRV